MCHNAEARVNTGQYTRIAAETKSATAVVLLLAAGLILAACATGLPQAAEPADRGWVTQEIFDQPLYAPFKTGRDTASIAPEYIDMIRSVSTRADVIVFFGGWCSDSKREVPRFLKLADLAGIPQERIRLYALDRTKKSDDGMTDRWHIERVPTFIFLAHDVEIGRITESPQTTMEADVLAILAGAGPR